jgi:acyl-CoA synthetase (AMP-forming)/AMP-acid ligase II
MSAKGFSAIRNVTRLLFGAAVVLAAWLAFSLGFAFVVPPGRSVAVIAPSGAQVVAAAGGSLLDTAGPVPIARSDDAAFVRRLYAAGAILVLDVEDAGGCTGLPKPKTAPIRL